MIEFKMISEFPKGTLYSQLLDAYSFDNNCKKSWDNVWKEYDVHKIIVTTNEIMFAAQKNYESVGFKKINLRVNKEIPFSGNYIDYEMKL